MGARANVFARLLTLPTSNNFWLSERSTRREPRPNIDLAMMFLISKNEGAENESDNKDSCLPHFLLQIL